MLTANMEDYLEAILIEEDTNKVVRVKGLIKSMDVKNSSVISALKILAEKDLITYEKHGNINLNEKGRRYAREIYQKHNILNKFIHEILGIEKEIAEQDACAIEHYIHKETFEKLNSFVKYIEKTEKNNPSFIKEFNKQKRIKS